MNCIAQDEFSGAEEELKHHANALRLLTRIILLDIEDKKETR